jgi:tetratricopeptide (TPR) repeat protein
VAQALEHLKLAGKFEPSAAEYKSVRAAIRTDLADALVGVGELQEARSLYGRALQADANEQRATAGLLNVSYLSGETLAADQGAAAAAQAEGASFDLLISQGLVALEAGDAPLAKERLTLAAQSDPLRAFEAWRALSYLAETTGNAAEALYYIDQAEANDPTDVYSLYQRGRILAQNDDTSGAMESLAKALDRELELPDALAALGRLVMTQGDHEAAERYFERTVGIDPRLASAHTLRGLNSLYLGRPEEARGHFEQALALRSSDPVASIGQAWCAYATGNPTEAKTLLREFEDLRRHLAEEDPYRVYANEQIARIDDWQEKVVWTDRFERQDLRNGWMVDEITDTKIFMRDGLVVMEGNFDKIGRTRLKRFYTSGDFVSFEAKLTVHSSNTVRVGLFVALEQRRGTREPDAATAEVVVSRHPQDKVVQYRAWRRGREDDPFIDSRVMPWADGQAVTLRLERYGESAKTAFRILVDGVPIAERVPMPALGATTREIVVGVFAEGESGRTVSVEIDDVEIVKREQR